MIKHLIESGCDLRQVDKNGSSVFHVLFRRPIESADDQKRRLDIIDILLTTHSNTVKIVFLNLSKTTPFLLACENGHDAIILRFLSFLDNVSIPIDYVIDYEGSNLFHHLLFSCRHGIPPTRLETVRTLIDKFPYADQLINAKNEEGDTPLHKLLERNYNDGREMIDLVNLLLQHVASPDAQNAYRVTYLDWAVWGKTASIFETLLRAGCRSSIFNYESPLSYILARGGRKCKSQSIRMIELLLAFGHDLQKELFLFTIDERPLEFTSPEYAKRRDTRGMDPNVLEALKELRRSNKMFSLRRQCRNTIRRHLKVKADEVIGNLTCIPDRIKSFLLVQNETPLLEESENQ